MTGFSASLLTDRKGLLPLLSIFFDPGILTVLQEQFVILIEALPFLMVPDMVGMDHAHRAPGKFVLGMLIHDFLCRCFLGCFCPCQNSPLPDSAAETCGRSALGILVQGLCQNGKTPPHLV
jgi:hypothetical protein